VVIVSLAECQCEQRCNVSNDDETFNQQTSGSASTEPVNALYMTGARCARN